MAYVKKKPLSEENLAECEALALAIKEYNQCRPRTERISQQHAAELMGITQGSFSSFLNGKLVINQKIAINVLKIFGIPIESYSPRLSAEINELSAYSSESNPVVAAKIPQSAFLAWEQLSIALIKLPSTPASGMTKALEAIEKDRARFNGVMRELMMAD